MYTGFVENTESKTSITQFLCCEQHISRSGGCRSMRRERLEEDLLDGTAYLLTLSW